MMRGMLPLLMLATTLSELPAQSAPAPDDQLVSVKYFKAGDSTILSGAVELSRTDTASGTALPKLTQSPAFALSLEFPGNGLTGAASAVDAMLGYFYTFPPPPADMGLRISIDGAAPETFATWWRCTRPPTGDNANAFSTLLSHALLHRLAEAKTLEFHVGGQLFSASSSGMAVLRALAARVPNDTLRLPVDPDSITTRAAPEWAVERPVLAVEGNSFPTAPWGKMPSHSEAETTVQFVVDTAGRAVMSTYRVLHTTIDVINDPVRKFVATSKFHAAMACARTVSQRVQMPFVFKKTY